MEVMDYLHDRHNGDASQLQILNTEERRLYVTAPAGYGKTRTMTSKAIQLLVAGGVPYPKRILCLTFSVNAARGMRTSLSLAMKEAASVSGDSKRLDCNRLFVTNYHGLSRRIIRLWLAMLGSSGVRLDNLKLIDDDRAMRIESPQRLIDAEAKRTILSFCSALKLRDEASFDSLLAPYRQVVLESLVPHGFMTYNGLLVLAIHALERIPAAREHLHLLYPCVMVDEAQDMNLLHWRLLNLVQSDTGRLLLFGDPVQRIYGFLGAIPKLETVCESQLNTVHMDLLMSHRFEADSPVGKIERCARIAARSHISEPSSETAEAPILIADSEDLEGALVARLANHIASSSDGGVAVLFRARSSKSADGVRHALTANGVAYFDGLFDENGAEFASFNELCLELLEKQTCNGSITSRKAGCLIDEMIATTRSATFSFVEAYVLLLNAFKRQLSAEFRSIDSAERYDLLYRTFSDRSLRNAAAYLDTRVSLMTVHAAKGLEWSTVIIPDMHQYGFPSGRFCYECAVKSKASYTVDLKHCLIRNSSELSPGYEDELNTFYVAVSRARERLYFVVSHSRITTANQSNNTLMSCLLSISGLKLRYFDDVRYAWNDGWKS